MPDGAHKWFDVVVSPLDESISEPARFLAISRDITTQHQLEEELKAARQKAEMAARTQAEFFATVSHELRTPLSAIISHLDLLETKFIDPAALHRIERIQAVSDDLMRIINDALDIAQIETGSFALVPQNASLRTLVESVLVLLEPLARRKSLTLTSHFEEPCPDFFVFDDGRMRQILINLLGNAIKFTEKGLVSLFVKAEPGEAERCLITFAVADTGIGISAKTRAAMFQSFSKSSPQFRRTYGGTGLGLAITRHLVHRMSGDIAVESATGRGSRFTVRLPLEMANTCNERDRQLSAGTAKVVRSKARVLVVDDNAIHREVSANLLESMGCKVETATNGTAALEAVKERTFDLLLIDEQMPLLNGHGVARRVLDLLGTARAPFIVICSANAVSASVRSTSSNERIVKPLTRATLRPVLRRVGFATNETHASHASRRAHEKHIEQFRESLEKLAVSIERGLANSCAELAHDLISSAVILGHLKLSRALTKLERSVKEGKGVNTAAQRAYREIDRTLVKGVGTQQARPSKLPERPAS